MKKIAILLAATLFASGVFAGNITVKGSDTLVVLAQKWAEVYMGQHPDTRIQVSGGGSGIGFAQTSICYRSCHVGVSMVENPQGACAADSQVGIRARQTRLQTSLDISRLR